MTVGKPIGKDIRRQKEMGFVTEECRTLPPRPDVRPWEQCSDAEKKLYSRMMEIFAGFPVAYGLPHRTAGELPGKDRRTR
jgi:hypothetical protein